MDDNGKKRINDYYKSNSKFKSLVLSLSKGWIPRQNKDFGVWEALGRIYDYANGNLITMTDILTHLTNVPKQGSFGRANTAYGVQTHPKIDILKNSDGVLELVGYDTNDKLTLPGQHGVGIDDRRLKKDGTVKKQVKDKEEVLQDVGAIVRKMYPNAAKGFIQMVDSAILKSAEKMHKSPVWVATQLMNGKLRFDNRSSDIVKNESIDRKVLVISESSADMLREKLAMTEYKFNNAIKKFLHDLLVDPVNAEEPIIFKFYGFTRGKLIGQLVSNGILKREQKINDKDEQGNPVTASMKIKFSVPKKDFDRKLKKLYIKLFEKNVPETITNKNIENNEVNIEETTACCGDGGFDGMGGHGAAGGAFIGPAFNDQEVISRGNGKNGSVSINNI